eukprot:15373897-Alexandrium_andersonii.AAC.1
MKSQSASAKYMPRRSMAPWSSDNPQLQHATTCQRSSAGCSRATAEHFNASQVTNDLTRAALKHDTKPGNKVVESTVNVRW